MKGLNLSKFRKVDDTDSHAIFRHDNGSELKVAKSGLSPQMRKDLESLPVHRADGDPAAQDPSGSYGILPPRPTADQMKTDVSNAAEGFKHLMKIMSGSSDVTQGFPTAAQQSSSQATLQQQPQAPSPNDVEDSANIPAQDSGQDSAGPSDAMNARIHADDSALGHLGSAGPTPGAPSPPPIDEDAAVDKEANDNEQIGKQLTQQDIKQSYMDEDMKVARDLALGHIQPKTYQSMYGDKDTLGKIGTIFGLMLSGAGSGLTHGPNLLMEMMNKEIQNDLEAQKSNKEGALNFLSAAPGNFALANMIQNRTTLHDLATKVNSLPLGDPKRAQAEQTLAFMASSVDAHNANLADVAAAKQAQMKMMMGQMSAGPSDMNSGAINYSKMNKLEMMGQQKFPGSPSSEDMSAMTKEASQLEEARALRTDFNNAFDSLDQSFLAGKFSPNQRDSYVNSLAGKLAKASAGRYNETEAKNQINAMIPKGNDWGDTRDVRRKNNDSFFDILESGTPTLKRFGLLNPKPARSQAKQPAAVDEIRYDSKGNSYKRGADGRPVLINKAGQ